MQRKTCNVVATAALGFLLVTFVASPGSADSKSDLERRKDGVSEKIDGAQKDVNESSKKLAAAANSLKRAQTRLDTAKAQLGKTRGQLAVARARDSQVQTQLDTSEAALNKSVLDLKTGQKSLNDAESQVRQFALQSLEDGDSGLKAFSDLLSGASPAGFSEQMSLSDAVSDAQIATMQRLDASKVILRINRDKVRALRNQVAERRRQAAANLVAKQGLETRASEQTAQVSTYVAEQTSAKRAAAKTLAEDAAQLREFEADRNKLSARLRALAAAELAKNKKHPPKVGTPPNYGGATTLFRPVNGPITSPYGMRVHPVTGVYKLHDGSDLGAACGTPIKAAADGTVLERYFNTAYGNRLIINHGVLRGVSVVTTYNHASGYIVKVGQRVSRGQTIGYVGSTGYSTGCHLHFMVITNGNTVNPMSWL